MSDKQFDLMWSMLQFGKQKSNIPALKELCGQLRQAMLQKTAGQQPYCKENDVNFDDVPTLINSIAIEAMCLYLSGDLDKLNADTEYREGELIIYQNGERFEIGKIKRLTDDGAFVYYHEGDTASKTPYDCMHKIINAFTIKNTSLGGGDDT
jgi:hypothetical protein